MENKQNGILIEANLKGYGEVNIDFENLTVGDYEELQGMDEGKEMSFGAITNLLAECVTYKKNNKPVFTVKSVKALKLKELRVIAQDIFAEVPKEIEDIKKK